MRLKLTILCIIWKVFVAYGNILFTYHIPIKLTIFSLLYGRYK